MRMDSDLLSLHIKHKRLQHSWSQRELALQLGTTTVNISRWERGITVPGQYYRYKLEALFGIPFAHLDQQNSQEEETHHDEPLPITEVMPVLSLDSLPSTIYHLPYRRNVLFTGREAILDQIRMYWDRQVDVITFSVQAISGLGGMGKTQLALEYAYRFANDYKTILWIRADSFETLLADCVAIAAVLQIPETKQQDQSHIVKDIKYWLENHTHWLLIFDNVESFEVANAIIPINYHGHILCTTRLQATGNFARLVKLPPMSLEEGTLLVFRRAKYLEYSVPVIQATQADYHAAMQLAELLVGLPLALDQAGAYIEESGCSISDYVQHYQKQQAAFLGRRGETGMDHPDSVKATFLLSFNGVRALHPDAIALLQLCAFLYPDAIPEEIISFAVVDAASSSSAFELDAAYVCLRKYSLIHRNADEKLCSIHRLVQITLQSEMSAEERRYWIEKVIHSIYTLFPKDAEIERSSSSWELCQRYVTQALTCIELIEKWNLSSDEIVALLGNVTTYLWKCAHYGQVKKILFQCIHIQMQLTGLYHHDVAELFNNLGVLHYYLQEYDQAELYVCKAQKIREHLYGAEHVSISIGLNNLALIYDKRGKYEQAEASYQRALSIREGVFGPEHPDIAVSLNSLGKFYVQQKKYVQAEAMFAEALRIREKCLEENHPRVAQTLHDFGCLRLLQQKYEEAEAFFSRALAIREQVLGSEHPDTMATLEKYVCLLDEAR